MIRGAAGRGREGAGAAVPDVAASVRAGVALFNAGRFWQAHEALEVVWRQAAPPERSLWQGLILAAAAMLHRERGNRHGVEVQGRAAIAKLRGPSPDGFPVETVRFLQGLAACVEGGGPVPLMELIEASAGGRTARQSRES